VATTKISVSVDRDVLADIRRLEGQDVNVSGIVDEALRARVARLELLAVLEGWEQHDPSSQEDQARAQELWRRVHD
jgi:post-segregation antitoxin (ccd killing protein)